MTAQERLASAMVEGVPAQYSKAGGAPSTWAQEDAAAILRADPDLAQDIADGQALRLLREALPDGWEMSVDLYRDDLPGVQWKASAYAARMPVARAAYGATIAEAADACRKALEARRG